MIAKSPFGTRMCNGLLQSASHRQNITLYCQQWTPNIHCTHTIHRCLLSVFFSAYWSAYVTSHTCISRSRALSIQVQRLLYRTDVVHTITQGCKLCTDTTLITSYNRVRISLFQHALIRYHAYYRHLLYLSHCIHYAHSRCQVVTIYMLPTHCTHCHVLL
jgi:hypothetical protein